MSLLSRIFGNRESEILCPHCERTMEPGHDTDACARKRMSRRFFFGVMAGAAVAVAAPQKPLLVDGITGLKIAPTATFATGGWSAAGALKVGDIITIDGVLQMAGGKPNGLLQEFVVTASERSGLSLRALKLKAARTSGKSEFRAALARGAA